MQGEESGRESSICGVHSIVPRDLPFLSIIGQLFWNLTPLEPLSRFGDKLLEI